MFRFIVRFICVPDYCKSKVPKTYLYTPELYRKRYKFRVLIKLDQAEELEHITDWSVIWHNFDVIENSTRRKEERVKGRTTRVVDTKESLKGSRKESSEDRDATCPTLLVLRQEDGAVRPEENTALLCLLFSVSVRKCNILDCDLQISRIIYCPTDLTRHGGQHSQNWFHQDDKTPSGPYQSSVQ